MARKRRAWTTKKKAAAAAKVVEASTVGLEELEGIGKEVVTAPPPPQHQQAEEVHVFDLARVKTEAFPDHLDDEEELEQRQDSSGGGGRVSNIDRLEQYLNDSRRRESVSQPRRKSSRIQVLKEKREQRARAELDTTTAPPDAEQKTTRQRKGRQKKKNQLPSLPPIDLGGLPQQWFNGGGGVKLELLPVEREYDNMDEEEALPVPDIIVPQRKIKMEVVSPPRSVEPPVISAAVAAAPDDSLGKELVVYNKSHHHREAKRRSGEDVSFKPFSSVAADKVYVVDREKDKALFDKPNGTILKAAVTNFHALMTETVPTLTKSLNREQAHNQALKATLVVAQDLEARLLDENSELRQRVDEYKAISDRERYRAEKAWQAFDGTKLYHRMKDEGEMQRHFLSQQYTAAVDVIRAGCDERLKAIEADRAKLCRENEVLHRKVEAGVKKNGKRVRALQSIVRVLARVIDRDGDDGVKQVLGRVLRGLGRERAAKEWDACFGAGGDNVDWVKEAVDAVLNEGFRGRVAGKRVERTEEDEEEQDHDTLIETVVVEKRARLEDFVDVEEARVPVASDKMEEEARVHLQDDRDDDDDEEEEEEESEHDEEEEEFVEVEEPSPVFEAALDMPTLPVFGCEEVQDPGFVDVFAERVCDGVPENTEDVVRHDVVEKGVVVEEVLGIQDKETQKIEEETLEGVAVVAGPVVTGPVVTGPVVTGPVVTGPVVTGPVVARVGRVVDDDEQHEQEEERESEKIVEEPAIRDDPRGAELRGKFVESWGDDDEEDDRPPILLLKSKSCVARERARGRKLRRKDGRGGMNMEQQQQQHNPWVENTWGEEEAQQRWNTWRSDEGQRRMEPYHHARNESFLRYAPPRDSSMMMSHVVGFPAHQQQLVGVVQPGAFGHSSSSSSGRPAFEEKKRQPTPPVKNVDAAAKSLKLEETIKKVKLEKSINNKEAAGKSSSSSSLSLRSRLTASMAEITPVGKGGNVCEKMKLEKHIAERMHVKKMEKLAAANAVVGVGVAGSGAKQREGAASDDAQKATDHHHAQAVGMQNTCTNLSDDDEEEEVVPSKLVEMMPDARNTEAGHSPISEDDVELPVRPLTPVETRGPSPISDESMPPPTPKSSRERKTTGTIKKRKSVKYTMDELFGDDDGEDEQKVVPKEVVPHSSSVLHDDLQVSDDDEEEEEEVANNKTYPPPPASPDPGDEADDEMMSGRQDFVFPHSGGALPIIFDLDPRLNGMFSNLLASPLELLLETDSIRMTFESRKWTLNELVECAYVQMAQTRDDELRAKCERAELVTVCPLVPAFARLLCVLNTVAAQFPREYGGLPTALLRFICDKVVQDDTRREMDNDELLVNVGRLVGAVTYDTGDSDLALAILLNFSLCRPPRVYAIAYGVLCSNTAVIGYIDMSQFETLCLTRRALLVSLVRNPRFGRNRFLRGVSDLFSRTLQIVVPEVGFAQYLESVIDEVCSLESDRELKKGAKVIAMLVVQLGLQYFDGAFTALASSWVQAWRDKRVSDGAVSAMFSSIGIVCQSLRREDVPETLEKQKRVVHAVLGIQSMPVLVRDTLNIVVDQIEKSVLRSPGDPVEFWNTPEPTRKRTASPKKKNKNKKRRVMRKPSDNDGGRRAAAASVALGAEPDNNNPIRFSGDNKPGTWVRGTDPAVAAVPRGRGRGGGGRGRGGRGGGGRPQWRRGRSSAQWSNE